MPESITISISSIQGGQYNYSLTISNDNPIIKDEVISPGDLRTFHQITGELKSIFRSHNTRMLPERQQYIGHQLFTIWLGKHWNAILNRLGNAEQVHINIISKDSLILNLPWELMTPQGFEFFGIGTRYSIRRYPGNIPSLTSPHSTLRAGPLRILFSASSPDDNTQLFFEKEEEYLQKAIFGLDVAYDSGDMGSFQELKERVGEFQPHIVHLSGHGVIVDDCMGYFAFEDMNGKADLKSSDEICRILSGQGVQCVFVSGCHSGEAPTDDILMGICQNLVAGGIPYAIGWASSIADIHAIDFVRDFYTFIASGKSIDQALNQVRWNLWKKLKQEEDLSWILPVLYASSQGGYLYDSHKPREEPQRTLKPSYALQGMKEGYARHFVGRRRKIQEILPKLGSGELSVVILTGLGGSGKSSLATKVTRKLEDQDHFTPLPIPCSREIPLSGDLILEIIGAAFGSPDNEPLFRTDLPLSFKFRHIFNILEKRKFILVLDNLETNLDKSNTIIDSGVAEFYTLLLSNLSGESRAIITSRYLPANVVSLPKTVKEIPLGDLPSSDVTKILRSDDTFEMLYRFGKIPVELLSDIHRVFGGVPRFIEQIVSLIGADPEQFHHDLKTVTLPITHDQNRLREIRDDYYNSIVLDRLFALLSDESKDALCRSAVYNVGVSPEGFAAVTGISQESISGYLKEWQSRAFVYPEMIPGFGEIWTVYGMLRPWLLNRLHEDERKAACNSAGDFLYGLIKIDRVKEIGISWTSCLLEVRSLYLEANNPDKAADATSLISQFFKRRGMYDLIRSLNQEILKRKSIQNSIYWVSIADLNQGEYESAKKGFTKVLKIRQEMGENNQIAIVLHHLATIDMNQGNYESAKRVYTQVLILNRQTANRAGIAVTQHQLATIEMNLGNYKSAKKRFKQVLNLRKEMDDMAGVAVELHNLATIDMNQGDYESAKRGFEQVLSINEEIKDEAVVANTLHNLAYIDLKQGNFDIARNRFNQVLKLRLKMGDKSGIAGALNQLAVIDTNQGNYGSARIKFHQALILRQKMNDKAGIASSLHHLASIDMIQGNYESAKEGFTQVLNLCHEIGEKVTKVESLHNLATIHLRCGEYDSAKKSFSQVLALNKQMGNKYGIANSLHQLAIINGHKGDFVSAKEGLNQALILFNKLGDKVGISKTLYNMATLDVNLGDLESAKIRFKQALTHRKIIGDELGIAKTQHNLAIIAMTQGDFVSAKEDFIDALKQYEKLGFLGDVADEFNSLGALANKAGLEKGAIILVGLAYTIYQSINHQNTNGALSSLQNLTSSYSEEQVNEILEESIKKYQDEGVVALVESIFDNKKLFNDSSSHAS